MLADFLVFCMARKLWRQSRLLLKEIARCVIFVFEIVVRSMPDVETLASELSVVMYAGNGATVKVALDDPYDGLVTLCTLDVSAEPERTTQFLGLHIYP